MGATRFCSWSGVSVWSGGGATGSWAGRVWKLASSPNKRRKTVIGFNDIGTSRLGGIRVGAGESLPI